MIEQEIEIPMLEGSADGVFFRPEGPGGWPGVIHLADIHGVRAAHRDKAKRLAEEGYAVLLPNVFYRAGRSPVWSFRFTMGEERSVKRMQEITAPLTPEAMESDAASYVSFLARQPGVSPGPMGILGHCYTGGMALRAAAACPDRIAAMASFHGGNLATGSPTSPHLVLPRVRARLYFGHAGEDRSMPAEAIARLEAALTAWGGRYESETYDDARHGWTVEDSAAWNADLARRAFEKLTALFAGTLR